MRLLFVPVSGPRGMGEYARSVAVASAFVSRWPGAEIHFALSRMAPYAASTPFSSTLLPSSPTFHTAEVKGIIHHFNPGVIIFDNAGRSEQIRAAAESGARVVFISSRQRQRRRAFRMRWMRLLDEHWIAWPKFVAGEPGPLENAKLRLLGRPVVRYIDTILPTGDPDSDLSTLSRYGVRPNEFVLVVPGGGTDHPGAENAPQIVEKAALLIAERGHPTLLVGVDGVTTGDSPSNFLRTPRIPMNELAALLRHSRVVISNGGDTLLQAILCKRPTLAVAIAGDQAHRIAQCSAAGFALRAELSSDDLAGKTLSLLADNAARENLTRRLDHAGITNGLEVAIRALHELATHTQSARSAESGRAGHAGKTTA